MPKTMCLKSGTDSSGCSPRSTSRRSLSWRARSNASFATASRPGKAFYDHLVSRLFQNALHRHQHNLIYFAKRGSRTCQEPLANAIRKGIVDFEEKWNTHVSTTFAAQAQTPQGEPCLSVVDYMNWAVYRAFMLREMRYFRVVGEKVTLLVDLYDTAAYPQNWYSRRNPFDTTKITPL